MKEFIFNEVKLLVFESGVIERNGKIVKDSNMHGYRRVFIPTPRGRKGLSVHRAVALTYLPNPENKPDVNHKDGNKSNNHVDNLEWSTREENMRHAKNTGLWIHSDIRPHVKSRDAVILNLSRLGVGRDIIQESFELNRPALNRILRVHGI